MSSPIPGHGASVPGSEPRSAPVAHVSRSALARNARLAAASGSHDFDPSILDADAWGHGAALVSAVLAAEGWRPGTRGSARSGTGALPVPTRTLSPETLFGLSRGGHREAVPALRLIGRVLSTKTLRAGEGVSYGYTYRAAADTRVALVTGGYAQGIVRSLGGAVDVAISGRRHPIVGRVAMDVCVVEIADAPVGRGDEVVFLGDPAIGEPGLGPWVEAAGMHPGELITAVGLRAHRVEAP